ncbi:MAG: FtsW/RodA/SpoVE family cell cycle protein, partial [Pseudonocardiaceae bacterium]
MLTAGVDAALRERVSLSTLYLPLSIGAAYGLLHVAIRFLAPYADPIILPCAAMINAIGLIFIWRLSLGDVAVEERADTSVFTGQGFRQLLWLFASALLFVVVLLAVRDHRILARFSYTAGFVGVALVMLPAVLPSSMSEVNGAKIWIRVGGQSIQPGEFAKLALLVFFASYLVAKRDVLSLASKRFLGVDFPRGRDLGPVVAAWVASLLVLVFERDLGSSLMYFGIFIAMLYVATERTSWLVIGLSLFGAGAFLAWTMFSHIQLRVGIWLDPFKDPSGDGFQIVQSLFGLGTGGLFGTGPGAGNPESLNQYASSDFIVATVGEEIGLFGLAGVLMLYLVIAQRGIRNALDVRDSFGKLLGAGLSFAIALQVFVIVGGVTKLIPLTGLTTPLLSYGGSSLVANWCLIALMIRISDAARRPPARRPAVLQLRHAPTEVI